MKTLTEFSTLTLRKAAAARAAADGGHKSESAVAVEAAPPVGEPAFGDGGEAPPSPEHDAPTVEGGPEVQDAPVAPEASEAAETGEPEPMQAEGAAAPTPAEDDPIVKAVSEAVGVQADRAQRLIEALDIIGDRIDQVRLVRVFQGEKGPHGAVSRGEFHYVIDRVAGSQRRRDDRRDDRRGGDRGGRGGGGGDRGRSGGGGGGGGGFGGDRGPPKPRGLGSLKCSDAKPDAKGEGDDRPGRGEMPRAGIGWQLTAAPRDFSGAGRGRGPGGPRSDRPRRDDRGGPRGPGAGPGGPGGDRPRRDDRGGPRGPRSFGAGGPGPGGPPRGPRPDRPQQLGAPVEAAPQSAQPHEPRLGPDGQPLPPRSKRPRKPIGPDANGNGPDGKPWDPERRALRQAERAAQGGVPSTPMNEAVTTPVEAPSTGNSGQTPTE